MKIAIIGSGNVASHLNRALAPKVAVSLINPHTPTLPDEVDIVLIAVSDDAIEDVVEKLPKLNTVVAHTSGSVMMDSLKKYGENYGVFYPLQTFTKDFPLDYRDIPVFIEGSTPFAKERLEKLASLFTDKIAWADSTQRKQLHLASVFACNFTNAMASMALEILKNSNFDMSMLLPLMRQTLKKLESLSPSEAQTGPAARNDRKIIETHLKMLENRHLLREAYKTITEFIQANSGDNKNF